jgi:hypothetical protein
MDDVLSITEIEARFDSEWVLIEDPRTNDALEVHGGTVRWPIRPKRFAIVYTPTYLKTPRSSCEFRV